MHSRGTCARTFELSIPASSIRTRCGLLAYRPPMTQRPDFPQPCGPVDRAGLKKRLFEPRGSASWRGPLQQAERLVGVPNQLGEVERQRFPELGEHALTHGPVQAPGLAAATAPERQDQDGTLDLVVEGLECS